MSAPGRAGVVYLYHTIRDTGILELEPQPDWFMQCRPLHTTLKLPRITLPCTRHVLSELVYVCL